MKQSFLDELRRLNIERQKEWDPENKATLSFRGLEFAGEAGELASKVKKLARKTEFDFAGSNYDMTDIKEEVGDVLITLDLLCNMMNIDIAEVTRDKFNSTSDKVGMKTKFEPEHLFIKVLETINKGELQPWQIIEKRTGRSIGCIWKGQHEDLNELNNLATKHYGIGTFDKHDFELYRFECISREQLTPKKEWKSLFFKRNDTIESEEQLYLIEWNDHKYFAYACNPDFAVEWIAFTEVPIAFFDACRKVAKVTAIEEKDFN